MADEVSGNFISKLSNRETFGGFSEDRMQLLLEGEWNKVEYGLMNSEKVTGQLEEFYDSKGIQTVFNGRTFEYHFVEICFICFPSTINFLTAFV